MLKKHHRWTRWWRSSAPPRPTDPAQIPAPAPTTLSRSVSAATPPSAALIPIRPSSAARGDVLEQALAALDEKLRTVIEEYVVSGTDDPALVLERARAAAEEKRRVCEARQWKIRLGGREVKLRLVADRVVALLDKFKAVGDVASNADPVHAGLPWAGIRLILEVAVSESRQMSALLLGMEMVLYMARRVRAYMVYLGGVPSSLERTNLEDALVRFHACILEFLARAIEAFGKSTAARIVDAFLHWDAYAEFRDKCFQLAERTEVEASNCDRVLQGRDRQDAARARKELANVLQQLESLQIATDSNRVKLDLGKLPVAEGAEFDSYDEQHLALCYPDTREELLQQINTWATQPDGKMIFWLNGMAGTGKSTISRTVAKQWRDERRLGASFFFKRGEGDRGSGKRFFPTLVAQMFQNVPGLQKPIVEVLDSHPDIAGKHLRQQFENLFLGCLVQNPFAYVTTPVVVIDALDECEERDAILILSLLRRMPGRVQLRVFLTSRPELPIRLGFNDMESNRYQDLVLHEIALSSIEHDITVLLKRDFSNIRTSHEKRHPLHPLPWEWPNEAQLQALVQLSVPLFIFAVTLCRFIGDERGDPVARLDKVLSQQTVSSAKLDQTYLPVLGQLSTHEAGDEDDVEQTKLLLGCIALLEEPLAVTPLSRLLRMEERDVNRKLDLFHSVLRIPDNPHDPVRLFHLSFRDFLVQKDGQKTHHRFAVSEQEIHHHLAIRCLNLLREPGVLHRDMCSLARPGVRRADVPQQLVTDSIPPEVSYACRYWVDHLDAVQKTFVYWHDVHSFLSEHLLHWLESLSWLGRSSESLIRVTALHSMVADQAHSMKVFTTDLPVNSWQAPGLQALLKDAKHFIVANRYIVDLAPLQLYASCILFAPDSSVIKANSKGDVILDLAFLPKMNHEWSPEIQKLEGHVRPVRHAVFSPDGTLIATSDSLTVRLWDAATGHELLTLGNGNRFDKIVFSSGGAELVSTTASGDIHIWRVGDGELIRSHNTETPFNSLASTPCSEMVVLGQPDMLYFYRVTTGEVVQELAVVDVEQVLYSSNGHEMALISRHGVKVGSGLPEGSSRYELENAIVTAAISPDGTRLALARNNNTITLCMSQSGELILTFRGHTDIVWAVAYSPSDDLIASSSTDSVILLWQATTGQVISRLKGHNGLVNSLAFSPDGSSIVSASHDTTVRVWNTSDTTTLSAQKDTDKSLTDLIGCEDSRPDIIISPDGGWIAVTAYQMSAMVYRTSTGRSMHTFKSFEGLIQRLNFSPNGESLCVVDDGCVSLYSLATGKLLWKMKNEGKGAIQLATSPDGTLAAFDSNENLIVQHMTTGQQCLIHVENHQEISAAIAFSYDNRTIAYSTGNMIRCWDLQAKSEVRQLTGLDGHVIAVAFSSNGEFIASASEDKTVRLWQAKTGAELRRLEWRETTYGPRIVSLSFCRDDTCLHTNQGFIDIQPDLRMEWAALTSVNQNWIQEHGEDMIWVPQLFRGTSKKISTMTGTVSVAHPDLTLIKFKT